MERKDDCCLVYSPKAEKIYGYADTWTDAVALAKDMGGLVETGEVIIPMPADRELVDEVIKLDGDYPLSGVSFELMGGCLFLGNR